MNGASQEQKEEFSRVNGVLHVTQVLLELQVLQLLIAHKIWQFTPWREFEHEAQIIF